MRDISQMHAHPELDAVVPRQPFLYLDGAGHRVDDGGELHQPPVPHALDDFAAMTTDRGREYFSA